jgi:K+-transporting ATPase ATPase A chain
MTPVGLLQIVLFFALGLVLTKPLGAHMVRVYQGEWTWLDPALMPVERGMYRLSGIDRHQEHGWRVYTAAMLLFNLVGLLLTYAILRVQELLPFNPQDFPGVAPDLTFNTSISFTTNTNWQNYVDGTIMSHFSQMVGLAVHNLRRR